MPHTTLITPAELAEHLEDPDWVIVDSRFNLMDIALGRHQYEDSHIPGAVYVHLEEDLSGPILPGKTGRHPLPDIEIFAMTLSRFGIDNTKQVVVYDGAKGAIAARLWWMLRWLGHEKVAVLEGGWQRWQSEGRPAKTGTETNPPADFEANPRPEALFTLSELESADRSKDIRLIDSREAERFRGESEPIDPVAGHIPGAISLPFAGNWTAEGNFLPPAELRARFEDALGEHPVESAVFYCGSGVTAAHNLLAMEHAGLPGAKLYPGSWSEWITDPDRPIAPQNP